MWHVWPYVASNAAARIVTVVSEHDVDLVDGDILSLAGMMSENDLIFAGMMSENDLIAHFSSADAQPIFLW